MKKFHLPLVKLAIQLGHLYEVNVMILPYPSAIA
jgi:hypothetical protein